MAQRDGFPIPAPEDREGYFGELHLDYWLSGLGDVLLLRAIAERMDRPFGTGQRLLDFGCASGRVLRHAHVLAPELDLYGVDIGRHNVEWARRHLPAAIAIAQGTVIPSLPFEDGSFDVVYAGSVFTHIDQFEEAWLLELRRVLKPGGFALLTFHPERIWSDLRDPTHPVAQTVAAARHRLDPPGIEPVSADVFDRPLPAERVVLTNVEYPVNNANVIHSHRWIRERWGRYLDVRDIIERAHGGHQDGAVIAR
jgi:ubiquinone/menaquinone biosynthesis C-methylase UbiE